MTSRKLIHYSLLGFLWFNTSVAWSAPSVVADFIDLGMINGARVYAFEVTSTEDVLGFDFSIANGYGFTGKFKTHDPWAPETDVPYLFPLTFIPAYPQQFPIPESYFRFSPNAVIASAIQDYYGVIADDLGAAFVGKDGQTLMPADIPYYVAIFSTADGQVPFYQGGTAQLASGQIVPVSLVPEPGTLALAGMSMIGLVLRRRKAKSCEMGL